MPTSDASQCAVSRPGGEADGARSGAGRIQSLGNSLNLSSRPLETDTVESKMNVCRYVTVSTKCRLCLRCAALAQSIPYQITIKYFTKTNFILSLTTALNLDLSRIIRSLSNTWLSKIVLANQPRKRPTAVSKSLKIGKHIEIDQLCATTSKNGILWKYYKIIG